VLQLAIKGALHSSSKYRETIYHCCCCVLLHFLRESLRSQNSREQATETSASCDTCTGRRAIKFLGSATLRDCSLVRTTTSWCCKLCSTTSWWCALLYYYFQKDVCGTTLLPFFLHQIRSTTSNCSTCRLLGTTPPEPPTLVLPLGITWCSHLFIVFFLFL
jgi:hypothetical protein